jgi:hypothetical protein
MAVTIIRGPQEAPGYYCVLVEDPDGILLEAGLCPGRRFAGGPKRRSIRRGLYLKQQSSGRATTETVNSREVRGGFTPDMTPPLRRSGKGARAPQSSGGRGLSQPYAAPAW